jgi:hypothetical protein
VRRIGRATDTVDRARGSDHGGLVAVRALGVPVVGRALQRLRLVRASAMLSPKDGPSSALAKSELPLPPVPLHFDADRHGTVPGSIRET